MVRDWSKQDLSQPTLSSSLSLPSSLPLSPPSLPLSLSLSLSPSLSLSLPPASSGSMGCHGRKARPAGLVLLRPSWKSRSWRSFCKACCFPSSIRSVRMLGSSRTHTQAGNFLPHMDLTVLESVAHTKKESKGWEGAYCSEAEPKCLQAISSKPIAQASAAGFWNSASYPQHQKNKRTCQLSTCSNLPPCTRIGWGQVRCRSLPGHLSHISGRTWRWCKHTRHNMCSTLQDTTGYRVFYPLGTQFSGLAPPFGMVKGKK